MQKRHLKLEQDVSSLQEQLQVEMDLRVALEVQDEEWQLAMDEEINAIERDNMWEFFDPSKGGKPIDKNLVKNKLATKIARNLVSNKSTKKRNKRAKEKIKSSTERVENKQIIMKEESSKKKAKNLTMNLTIH